jgi:hypothetical protein
LSSVARAELADLVSGTRTACHGPLTPSAANDVHEVDGSGNCGRKII